MNAVQPEIVATRRGPGSAEVTVRASLTTAYLGTCDMHNRPVRLDLGEDLGPRAMVPYLDGDHQIPARRLVIVESNVTCDGSCWGANHGRAWAIASASLADPEALAQAWRGACLGRREVFEERLAAWRAARTQAAEASTDRREKRKTAEQRRARVTFADWAAANGDIIEALRPWLGSAANRFLANLALQVTEGRNGQPKPLSPAQLDAARRTLDGEARRVRIAAEREAAKRPAPVGPTTITGRVVKVSYRSRDAQGDLYRWGPQHRMTVSCEGYAVQVPVPAAVDQWARENRREELHRNWCPSEDDYTIAERWTDALRGLQVTLTTTVSRSDRDPTFGFGKGASGVQILAEPSREAEAG